MKEKVLQEPTVNFLNLREYALRWTDMKKPEVRINPFNSGVDSDSVEVIKTM